MLSKSQTKSAAVESGHSSRAMNPKGYYLTAFGIIALIGGSIATGSLYSRYKNMAFTVGGGGVVLGFLSCMVAKCCCEAQVSQEPVLDFTKITSANIEDLLVLPETSKIEAGHARISVASPGVYFLAIAYYQTTDDVHSPTLENREFPFFIDPSGGVTCISGSSWNGISNGVTCLNFNVFLELVVETINDTTYDIAPINDKTHVKISSSIFDTPKGQLKKTFELKLENKE